MVLFTLTTTIGSYGETAFSGRVSNIISGKNVKTNTVPTWVVHGPTFAPPTKTAGSPFLQTDNTATVHNAKTNFTFKLSEAPTLNRANRQEGA